MCAAAPLTAFTTTALDFTSTNHTGASAVRVLFAARSSFAFAASS
ncbi:hypothetical protein SMD44_06046 [Streptomyces alboflavus]|uniref:Uncharacterized protein n=1 Tax=Streptomyces alboflavus TaxID=67267 RepID=A0A1Z1WJF6_9ACTN|nr:hypothetical protein SMD44_06046 [Streptomyces alboflavus]